MNTTKSTGTAKTLGLIDGETVEIIKGDDWVASVVRKDGRRWEFVIDGDAYTSVSGAEKITIRR
jgi:hypothetical protein